MNYQKTCIRPGREPLGFVGAAQAQTAGVVTLRANQTSGTGSLTPVLTWSTNPAAAELQRGRRMVGHQGRVRHADAVGHQHHH